MVYNDMIDTASEISYRIYAIIGFATGTLTGAVFNHLEEIALTFIMGASSALGAVFIKFVTDKIKSEKKKQEEMREFLKEEIGEAIKELEHNHKLEHENENKQEL